MRFWFLLAAIYTVVLVYFSLSNTKLTVSDDFPHKDKILHYLAYIVLVVVWGVYFKYSKAKKPLKITFLSTLVFGIVLECVQEWINPTREFDLLDLLANCLGVITGIIIVRYYIKSKVKLI